MKTRNQAYEECAEQTRKWIVDASDKSEIIKTLLHEIAIVAEENGIRINYDVRD